MTNLNNEAQVPQDDKMLMPTVAHEITLHFKALVLDKKEDADKIALLRAAAEQRPHVKFEAVKNVNAQEVEQDCIKRVSETYTIQVPDFAGLLAQLVDDIDGLSMAEIKRVQELVAKHLDTFARKLVEGSIDDNGEVVGFETITADKVSFADAAKEAFGRKGGAGSAKTVPAALRDEGIESFVAYLESVGVTQKGRDLMSKAARTYFAPTTVGVFNVEALTVVLGRITGWYDSLGEVDKSKFELLFTRWDKKLNDLIDPEKEELEIDIL